MNKPNNEVDVKTSSYNNPFATTLYVAIFWTMITLSSWLLRRAICWLFDYAKSTQTTKESTKNMISVDVIPRQLKLTSYWSYLDKHLYSNRQLLITLLDSIATIEICACSLECWIIREAFGSWGFLIAIALNCIRSSLFVSFDANGSPCDPWYRFLLGQTQPIWMVFTWTLQLLSASIALKLCKYWWSLQMTAYHIARYELALEMLDSQTIVNHTSDLQVVFIIGFLCEAIGTFIDLYLNILFLCILENWNSQYSSGDSQKLSSVTNSKVSSSYILTRKQLLTSYIIRLFINLILIAYGKL
ncbi:Aquaporin-like domain-containing protein [Schistosoma japonicum]|nr:Aquaporin-like domain-containing protein [Schistosoma japonicum]